MVETTTTLTVRLDRLARDTHRSKSTLAAQAIKDYVGDQLRIIDGIKQAEADARAGRVESHGGVMAGLASRFNLTD